LNSLQGILSVDALESVSWSDIDRFPQYLPSGRPTIAPGGVVHSATGQSAAIAPGELITVYGTYFGAPAGGAPPLSPNGGVPLESAGTSVSINGAAAPLLFISPTQINAVTPFGTSASGSAELNINALGYRSEPLLVPAAPAAPGLFTTDGSGTGQAIALNQDGTSNSTANPASMGDIVTVYGTGFGSTMPISLDGVLTDSNLLNITLPVSVTLAGKDAPVTYAGSAPGLISGISQIKFRIPRGLQPGAATVVANAGDVASPDSVTIAVQ